MIEQIKTAMEAAPAVFVPQMLFAGFYIKMEQIPVFLRWLQYICGLKWAMNIALANECVLPRVSPTARLRAVCIESFRARLLGIHTRKG